MDIVLLIHALVRFLLLIVALVGVIYTLVGLFQQRAPVQMDQTLGSVFVGVYDLQMLLGLLIILLGGLTQAIHPVVMFIGLVVAHGLQTMTRRAQGPQVWPMRLALYIAPLVIILVGLASIGRLPT